MNLLDIQDRLNKLPARPESIQYLTAASHGQNPQVPPYMALARISEINKEIQTAQAQQPPAEPLNQSLPKQALQNMGIGALGQGQPVTTGSGAALQTGFGGQVMTEGAPAPQQPAPQVPQMQAPQPVMAAEGGLMSLPVDASMFEYGSGGVVAFANPEGNQLVEESDEDEDEDVGEEADVGGGSGVSYDAVAELRRLQPQIAAQMKQDVRPVRSRADIEKELIKKKDYGIDEGPIGKGYLEGLGSLKEAKAADRAQQQANIDERKKFITSRSLLDYSDASRGQTGLGGIGALARSRMNATEKFMNEETDLRQAGIKVDELLNDAQYKVQALRQAQRAGDVKEELKNDMGVAKIAGTLGVSKNRLLQAALTGNLGVIGKQIMANAQVQSAKERAKGKGAGAKKPTDLGTSYEIELAALLGMGEPDDAVTRKKAMNIAQRNLSKSAGSERVDVTRIKEANDAFENRMVLNRELNRIRKSNPTAYQAGVAKLKEEIKAEFGVKPTITEYDSAVPASTPAPAAASNTPPVSALKEGVATKFKNGQTWTLKNGKPERVS